MRSTMRIGREQDLSKNVTRGISKSTGGRLQAQVRRAASQPATRCGRRRAFQTLLSPWMLKEEETLVFADPCLCFPSS